MKGYWVWERHRQSKPLPFSMAQSCCREYPETVAQPHWQLVACQQNVSGRNECRFQAKLCKNQRPSCLPSELSFPFHESETERLRCPWGRRSHKIETGCYISAQEKAVCSSEVSALRQLVKQYTSIVCLSQYITLDPLLQQFCLLKLTHLFTIKKEDSTYGS